jgi:hypothetical protein
MPGGSPNRRPRIRVFERPPKRPKTPQTGLVGANYVKAPPPPLYTFEGLIEFKQLAPESRIARDQDMFQASHLGFPGPAAVMFSS